MTDKTKLFHKELFDVGEAAKYLGVSRSHFDEALRKLLPVVDMGAAGKGTPLVRFAKSDLDALISKRRREVA